MSTRTLPTSRRVAELEARAAVMVEEMEALAAKPSLTPQQDARLDALTTAAERLDGQIEEARAQHEARLAAVREHAGDPAYTESGDGARHNHGEFQFMRRGDDPWADEVRAGQDTTALRDRALYACERSDDITEPMTEIVERLADEQTDSPGLGARWAITTSRPAYRSFFEKFMRHPGDFQIRLTDEERHAFTAVEEVRASWLESNTGSYAVPAAYDLAVMIQASGSASPIRQISSVVQTTSNIYRGIGTAGISAAFSTESVEVSNGTPALTQPSWTVQRATAYAEASWETVQDAPSLANDVVVLFADAKANLENEKFITGAGTTSNEPFGVVTRCASLNAYVFSESGSTVERDLTIGDIYKLDNAVEERYYANASWLMHRATANKIRRFGEGTTGSNSAFWTDLGGGVPPLLLGHPLFTASAFDSVVASGSEDHIAILGDFRRAYRVVDRVGSSVSVNVNVTGSSGRPLGATGWLLFWRTTGDVTDQVSASGLKMLHL